MIQILLNFENWESRYKEATSPMSGYQGPSKDTRFTMKIRYWFVLQMQGV